MNNIMEVLRLHSESLKNHPAFVFRDKDSIGNISYLELYKFINLVGVFLNKKDCGSVALISENRFEWILFFLSSIISRVCLPINTDMSYKEIEKVIQDVGCKTLIYSNRFRDIAEKLKDSIDYFICLDEQDNICDISYNDLLHYTKSMDDIIQYNSKHGLKDDDLCLIIYTSGTTNKNKGVMFTNRKLMQLLELEKEKMIDYKKIVQVLPMYHSYGLIGEILYSLYCGKQIFINYSKKDYINDIKFFAPDAIFLTPMLINKTCDYIEHDKNKFTSLKFFISAGANLHESIVDKAENIGIKVLSLYGATECLPISMNTLSEYKKNSVGKGFSNSYIKISVKGEILVNGPNVMLGYYKEKSETDKVIQDGWIHTGDLGYLDEEGFLFITGRINNAIILTNGKKVFPEELENKISYIDFVKENLVYSNGDKIITDIYYDTYSNKEKEEYITSQINHINKTLPLYKNISKINFIYQPIHKTSTHKIIRRKNIK